jgi:putative hemolysin
VLGQATDAGEVSPRASDIANRAIDLDALHVGSVMVPRPAIVAIDVNATIDDLMQTIDISDEERFPVRRGGENIIGYVTTRDIARLLRGRVEDGLASIVRPVHVVPESARALDVLDQLQSKRIPIAIVVDESGGIEGVVDIDDLAEELLGSLLVGEHREDALIVREPDGAAIVPATMRVHVINRRLELDLPISVRWSTIGGLVLAQSGVVPAVGTRVALADGTVFEVIEASARRVHRVRVRPPVRDDA